MDGVLYEVYLAWKPSDTHPSLVMENFPVYYWLHCF